jgi:poly-beta-1,6-N-acetyl-D-glucosamine synthase
VTAVTPGPEAWAFCEPGAISNDQPAAGDEDAVKEPPRYVLITPARDEAANIARTIAAMRAQTMPPARWVIVDDGSTDGTADLVQEHARDAPWIRLVHRRAGTTADFASKVHAFRAGHGELHGTDHDFVGNLDADLSFEPDYFQRVLEAFAHRPALGIAGGHVVEVYGGHSVPQRISPNSVAGAVQLFRRETFEAIGGIRPLRLGGEDAAAEILARMHGWEVATLFELTVRHHGRVLARNRSPIRAWYTRGVVNRSLGYHPLFQVAVSGYRAAAQPPYLLSGLAMLAGYAGAAARRVAPALDPDAVSYLRAEQRQRLLSLTSRLHREAR